MIVILTSGSAFSIRGRAFPPHGNPVVYSIAISWLISIAIAFVSSAIFFRVNPTLFSLAHWEKQGEIYDRAGIRAFRWVLFHSPLGWINPNFHLRASRADCDRLLREMNSSEGVHWLTFGVSSMLAISYLLHDRAVYGYVLLLVRIPLRPVPHNAPTLESRSRVAGVGTPCAYHLERCDVSGVQTKLREHLLNPRHPRISGTTHF